MEKKIRLAGLSLICVCLFTFSFVASVLGQDKNDQETEQDKKARELAEKYY